MSSGEKKLPETLVTLGVSGYLMESDVLLWDRETQTLWSQIDGRGIAGPRAGTHLPPLPTVDTTWRAWRRKHTASKVLRAPGPAGRYGLAYGRYRQSDKVMFAVQHRSDRLPNKAIVTGVRLGDHSAAWSHEALAEKAADRDEKEREKTLTWNADVGGFPLTLHYDPVGDSVTAQQMDEGGERADVPTMRLYWFAWFTFHPKTTLDGE